MAASAFRGDPATGMPKSPAATLQQRLLSGCCPVLHPASQSATKWCTEQETARGSSKKIAPSSAVSSIVQPGSASDTAEAMALRKGISAPPRCSATTLPATISAAASHKIRSEQPGSARAFGACAAQNGPVDVEWGDQAMHICESCNAITTVCSPSSACQLSAAARVMARMQTADSSDEVKASVCQLTGRHCGN